MKSVKVTNFNKKFDLESKDNDTLSSTCTQFYISYHKITLNFTFSEVIRIFQICSHLKVAQLNSNCVSCRLVNIKAGASYGCQNLAHARLATPSTIFPNGPKF